MEIEQIRQDLRDVRIFCGRYFPFIVIPLSYVRIVATKAVPTAGVDRRGVLVVNPDWWSTLNMETKRFVAIHEVCHITLCHPFRAKGFNHVAFNLAADGKVNYAITSSRLSGVSFPSGGITLNSLATVTGLRASDLEKMSTEEITRILEKLGGNNGKDKNRGTGGIGDDLLNKDVAGEVVQQGDKCLKSAKSREERKRVWKRLAEKAKAFAKQAGTMPAALERLVDEVLEVKPPWQVTVRFGLRNSSKFDSSFAYPNRRSDDYPGPLNYRYIVWALIDTSGSIGMKELEYFLGIVKHEVKNASLKIIAWDAEAYEVLRADRPVDVARKVAPKMKGGGGTMVLPVLQKVYKLMNPGDAVIVLTDGFLSDSENSETQTWFRRVARKAGFAMIGYTEKPVEAPGFSTSHINFRGEQDES